MTGAEIERGTIVSRVSTMHVASGVRIVIDGEAVGPVLTARAARVIVRWLEGGALEEIEGEGREVGGTVGRALRKVDDAIDAVSDLLKHGPPGFRR